MSYRNLGEFIARLETEDELIRISTFVDPRLEIAEITDRVSKSADNNKALLFENTGFDFPVLINAYGSEKRMCLALGVTALDEIAKDIEQLFSALSSPKEGILEKLRFLPKLNQFAGWMPKVAKGRGSCQAVVHQNPDISQFPVLTCWPKDGGPFITLPIIHTKDPNTKIRNVGMYRMQVFGPRLTAMHWHKHKVSAKHFSEYQKIKQKMPVAVALGGDPVYAYCATAPLPENVDEYMLAGFIRKRHVELVKCITCPDIEVPSDAEIIIEGFIDPEEELIWEGPFGDHTGYYSLEDWYPRFHITCITHRPNPIYPATIVGIPPQEDAWLGKATERIFLAPMKMTLVPEIVDMEMPVEGVFHNLVIAKIQKSFAGQAQKVMNAMWGAGQMMFNKILVLIDGDINIRDYREVAKSVFRNLNPSTDIFFSQGPMDVLDHSCSKLGFGGKMCIDGTLKFPEEKDGDIYHSDFEIQSLPPAEKDLLLERFPEIRAVNFHLPDFGIPCIIIALFKSRSHQVSELHRQICNITELSRNLRMILYVDHTVDVDDLPCALWRLCNNLDPKRDHIIFERTEEPGIQFSCVGFDGTRKTKELDNFTRLWPNIIVSDEGTIRTVDKKWFSLGIGDFIQSPSIKYKDQLYGTEAFVS
ncbi:MAG TPA: menaquinone biosynthesis decarboxylase [Puia sp.]|nr:menaquinone biosynthesis decarboxylase [Puia sp.]